MSGQLLHRTDSLKADRKVIKERHHTQNRMLFLEIRNEMTPHPLQEYSDAGNAVFPAPGSAITTLRPRNEAKLVEFMRRASQEQKPVTITAALTGLAGAGVPLESGYRIDVSEMTTIEERKGYCKSRTFSSAVGK